MPRRTANLVRMFGNRITEAQELVQMVEASVAFSYTRRLYVYEAAYLLAFSAWENFLEESLLRFLCGYRNRRRTFARVGGAPHHRSLAAAKISLYGASSYLLWHN